MSFEQEKDDDYSYSKEYDEPETESAKPNNGRNPSKNERRQARKAKIEEKKHMSRGNSNFSDDIDPQSRTARAKNRQPGIHNNLRH
jgi:hypothetical protein